MIFKVINCCLFWKSCESDKYNGGKIQNPLMYKEALRVVNTALKVKSVRAILTKTSTQSVMVRYSQWILCGKDLISRLIFTQLMKKSPLFSEMVSTIHHQSPLLANWIHSTSQRPICSSHSIHTTFNSPLTVWKLREISIHITWRQHQQISPYKIKKVRINK